MKTRLFPAILFGCLLITVVGNAQAPSSSPWFGVATPHGLGDPPRPIIDVAAAKPIPALVPAGEEKNHELEGAAVRQHLEAIVGIARADRQRGEKAWGRITGFPGADQTHQWV